MKRPATSAWFIGYFFVVFCVGLVAWVWAFKGIISHKPFPEFGAGAIIGAVWALILVGLCRTVSDSGKELLKALKGKNESDHV